MNRKPNSFRHIANSTFSNIVNFFLSTYPNYNWKVYFDNASTIKNFALIYASSKFIFAPTGSGMIGIIFMKPYSFILSAEANSHDIVFRALSINFQIFYLTYSSPNNKQFSYKPFRIKIHPIKRLCNIAFYVIKYKCWPNSKDLFFNQLDLKCIDQS